MTPGEEAFEALLAKKPPTAASTAAPAAVSAAPAAPPSATGGTPGEQAFDRLLQGKPIDDRSWWQRNVTGEGAYDPSISELGNAQMPSGADWQAYALPFMTSDAKGRANILEKHIKGARQDTDKYGNPLIYLPGQGEKGDETKPFYLNRPGVSEADLQGLAADVATSLPAARLFSGIRGAAGIFARGLAQMGTQGAREVGSDVAGAETPYLQSAANIGLAGAGSVGGDLLAGAAGKAIGKLTPSIDEGAVSKALAKADVDWPNLPPAGQQQIMSRLNGMTPGQAKAVLENPKNLENLYRSSLQPEFGQLNASQITGDAARIGRDTRRGWLPGGQTDEIKALLDRQGAYFKDKLLGTEGEAVANLAPATISSRFNMILKDPEAKSLFSESQLAELKRAKDFADLLRQKGTGGGDIMYKMLQRLGGTIPSMALGLGMGAAGFHTGGLTHMLAGGLTSAVPSATRAGLTSWRQGVAQQLPPLAMPPISLPGAMPGLLGSNLAVENRGLLGP